MIPFIITCAALAAMVGIAILILIAMNAWANAVRLPDELRETPMDLLNEISAPTDTAALEEFLGEVKEDDDPTKVFLEIHYKRNPGLTAIPPFFEMMNKRIPPRGFHHKFSWFHFTQIAPLKRRQVLWLKQRTAYVEELHRLVHSGPLPRVSVYDDQMQLQKVNLSPYIMGLTKEFDITDHCCPVNIFR